jgi:8-oxo-dGTP pyrophosphatase MutT (NUDIX family)
MRFTSLLQLLRDHRANELEETEANATARTISFIESEPRCLERQCIRGHLTGSAWVVSPDRSRVLLTHHRKLDKWLQLGGHADGDPDLAAVAMREACEESGLKSLRLARTEIFDVDIHEIPSRGAVPRHLHFDLRFLIEANPDEPLTVTSESKDLQWVATENVSGLNPEESILRLVRKSVG